MLPVDPAVVELGRRWHAILMTFSEGNGMLGKMVGKLYRPSPEIMANLGSKPTMAAYIGEAKQAAGLKLQA